MYFSAQVSEMGAMIGSVETGVQTLYDGVRDRFHAWRRRSRLCQKSSRPHRQERELVDYKLYVAEQSATKEFLAESKR